MKKTIAVLMTAAVLSCSMVISAGAESSISGASYTNSFDSMEDLNGWEAYFLANPDTAGAASVKEDLSKHWTIENGKLKRINDFKNGSSTTNAAILTFTEMKFQYFELTVKYQKVEGNWPWAVVAFGASMPGKYFTHQGCGVFVQDEGKVTIWGTTPFDGPNESAANSGYVAKGEHTMKLRVTKDNVEVTIDDKWTQSKKYSNIPEGYISLMSIENIATFDDLSITALDEDGNPVEGGLTEAPTTTTVATTTEPEDPNVTYPAAETTLTSGQAYDMEELAQGTVKGDPKDESLPTADGSGSSANENTLWIVLGIVGGVVVVAAIVVVLLVVLKKKKDVPTLPKE